MMMRGDVITETDDPSTQLTAEEREKRVLNQAAIKLAQTIHDADVDGVRRVHVDGSRVRVEPVTIAHDTTEPEQDRDTLADTVEALLDGHPYTTSEWHVRRNGDTAHLVVAPYQPIWGKCTLKQERQYDEFIEGWEL